MSKFCKDLAKPNDDVVVGGWPSTPPVIVLAVLSVCPCSGFNMITWVRNWCPFSNISQPVPCVCERSQMSSIWIAYGNQLRHQPFVSPTLKPMMLCTMVLALNRADNRNLLSITNLHPIRFLHRLTFFCNIIVKLPTCLFLRRTY